jgi:hypothetical protein
MREPAGLIGRLRANGFLLAPLPSLLGRIDGLHAVRYLPDYVDCAVLRGPQCAVVARVPDRFDPHQAFREVQAEWSKLFDNAYHAVDELLHRSLPTNGESHTPQPRPTTGRHARRDHD